jgi:hypothetical protein
MQRKYADFNEIQRRSIRKQPAGFVAFYGTVFCVFVVLVIANRTIGHWVANAVQAETSSQKTDLAVDPMQLTLNVKDLPTVEVREPF